MVEFESFGYEIEMCGSTVTIYHEGPVSFRSEFSLPEWIT